MTSRVLIAVQGPREAVIAAAVGSATDLTVARRCADLGEALSAAHAGQGTVVVLSEQQHLNRAAVAEFDAAGTVVVGAPGSAEAAEQLRGVGLSDLIPVDADAQAIVTLIQRAAHRARVVEHAGGQGAASASASASASVAVRAGTGDTGTDGGSEWAGLGSQPPDAGFGGRGVVIAVWGPAGAPGRTTVAVAMAYEMARATGALLVDVDTYGGAVAQALGLLDEAPGIAAVARASLNGTLTSQTVHRHALHAGSGLSVLSGMTRADRWPELSRAALDPVWDLLREMSPVTIVDCGFCIEQDEELQYDTRAPQRNAATISALQAADAIVVVGSAEPLGIQRLVQALQELGNLVPADVTARVVVANRVRASVAGTQPRRAVADALRRYAGVEAVWTIGWDPRACDAATLTGQALPERAPRSSIRKSLQAISLEALRVGLASRAAVPELV